MAHPRASARKKVIAKTDWSANIPKVLQEYQDVQFVDRINNPQKYPMPERNADDSISTHLLSAEIDDDGIAWVFPNKVLNKEDNTYTTYDDNFDALAAAKESGNAVRFSTIEEADFFSKNYKNEDFEKYYQPAKEEKEKTKFQLEYEKNKAKFQTDYEENKAKFKAEQDAHKAKWELEHPPIVRDPAKEFSGYVPNENYMFSRENISKWVEPKVAEKVEQELQGQGIEEKDYSFLQQTMNDLAVGGVRAITNFWQNNDERQIRMWVSELDKAKNAANPDQELITRIENQIGTVFNAQIDAIVLGAQLEFMIPERHSSVTEQLQNIMEAGGLGEALYLTVVNPKATSSVIFESLAQYAPTLTEMAMTRSFLAKWMKGWQASVATSPVIGRGSYMIEYYNVIREQLTESGVDLKDREAIRLQFADEEWHEKTKEIAKQRGIPIMIFDMISLSLAGHIYSGIVKRAVNKGSNVNAAQAVSLALEAGVQAIGGGGGEAMAQWNVHDELTERYGLNEWRWGDIALEAVSEIAVAIPAAVINKVTSDSPLKAEMLLLNRQIKAIESNPDTKNNYVVSLLKPHQNYDELDSYRSRMMNVTSESETMPLLEDTTKYQGMDYHTKNIYIDGTPIDSVKLLYNPDDKKAKKFPRPFINEKFAGLTFQQFRKLFPNEPYEIGVIPAASFDIKNGTYGTVTLNYAQEPREKKAVPQIFRGPHIRRSEAVYGGSNNSRDYGVFKTDDKLDKDGKPRTSLLSAVAGKYKTWRPKPVLEEYEEYLKTNEGKKVLDAREKKWQTQEFSSLSEKRISSEEAVKQASKIPLFLKIVREGKLEQVKEIFTPEGNMAWGSYRDNIIQFVENPKETTLPHETFHAFIDLFAEEKRKQTAFNAVRLRAGNKDLSDSEVEEILSEEFASWFLEDNKPKGVIEKFFAYIKKLMQTFSKDGKINKLFEEAMNPHFGEMSITSSLKPDVVTKYQGRKDVPPKDERKEQLKKDYSDLIVSPGNFRYNLPTLLIEAVNPQKAYNSNHWNNLITGWINNGDVKAEEVRESKVIPWLKGMDDKAKIKTEEILGFMKENTPLINLLTTSLEEDSQRSGQAWLEKQQLIIEGNQNTEDLHNATVNFRQQQTRFSDEYKVLIREYAEMLDESESIDENKILESAVRERMSKQDLSKQIIQIREEAVETVENIVDVDTRVFTPASNLQDPSWMVENYNQELDKIKKELPIETSDAFMKFLFWQAINALHVKLHNNQHNRTLKFSTDKYDAKGIEQIVSDISNQTSITSQKLRDDRRTLVRVTQMTDPTYVLSNISGTRNHEVSHDYLWDFQDPTDPETIEAKRKGIDFRFSSWKLHDSTSEMRKAIKNPYHTFVRANKAHREFLSWGVQSSIVKDISNYYFNNLLVDDDTGTTQSLVSLAEVLLKVDESNNNFLIFTDFRKFKDNVLDLGLGNLYKAFEDINRKMAIVENVWNDEPVEIFENLNFKNDMYLEYLTEPLTNKMLQKVKADVNSGMSIADALNTDSYYSLKSAQSTIVSFWKTKEKDVQFYAKHKQEIEALKEQAAKSGREYGLESQKYPGMTLDNVGRGYTILSQSMPGGKESFNTDSKEAKEKLLNLIKGTEDKIKKERDILWEMTGVKDFQIEDLDNELVKKYMGAWMNRLKQFNAGVITAAEYRKAVSDEIGVANANYSTNDSRPYHPIQYAVRNQEAIDAGLKPQFTEKQLMRDIKQRLKNIAWWKRKFKETSGVSFDAGWVKAAELPNFGEYFDAHYARYDIPIRKGLSQANIFHHARGNVIDTINIRDMLKGSNNVLNSDPPIDDLKSKLPNDYTSDEYKEMAKSIPIKMGNVTISKPLFLKVEAQSDVHQHIQGLDSKKIWLDTLRKQQDRLEKHTKEHEEKFEDYSDLSRNPNEPPTFWDNQWKTLAEYYKQTLKEDKENILRLEEERKVLQGLTGYAKTDVQSKKNVVGLVSKANELKEKENDIENLLKTNSMKSSVFEHRFHKFKKANAKELLHGIGKKSQAVSTGRNLVKEIHRLKLPLIGASIQDFFIAKLLERKKLPPIGMKTAKSRPQLYENSLLDNILIELAKIDSKIELSGGRERLYDGREEPTLFRRMVADMSTSTIATIKEGRKYKGSSLSNENSLAYVAAKELFDELMWHLSPPSSEEITGNPIDKLNLDEQGLSSSAVGQAEENTANKILLANKDFKELKDVINIARKQKTDIGIELKDIELKVSSILGRRWHASSYDVARGTVDSKIKILKNLYTEDIATENLIHKKTWHVQDMKANLQFAIQNNIGGIAIPINAASIVEIEQWGSDDHAVIRAIMDRNLHYSPEAYLKLVGKYDKRIEEYFKIKNADWYTSLESKRDNPQLAAMAGYKTGHPIISAKETTRAAGFNRNKDWDEWTLDQYGGEDFKTNLLDRIYIAFLTELPSISFEERKRLAEGIDKNFTPEMEDLLDGNEKNLDREFHHAFELLTVGLEDTLKNIFKTSETNPVSVLSAFKQLEQKRTEIRQAVAKYYGMKKADDSNKSFKYEMIEGRVAVSSYGIKVRDTIENNFRIFNELLWSHTPFLKTFHSAPPDYIGDDEITDEDGHLVIVLPITDKMIKGLRKDNMLTTKKGMKTPIFKAYRRGGLVSQEDVKNAGIKITQGMRNKKWAEYLLEMERQKDKKISPGWKGYRRRYAEGGEVSVSPIDGLRDYILNEITDGDKEWGWTNSWIRDEMVKQVNEGFLLLGANPKEEKVIKFYNNAIPEFEKYLGKDAAKRITDVYEDAYDSHFNLDIPTGDTEKLAGASAIATGGGILGDWFNKGKNVRIPGEDKASWKTLGKDSLKQLTRSDAAFKAGKTGLSTLRPLKAFTPSMLATGPEPLTRQLVNRSASAISKASPYLSLLNPGTAHAPSPEEMYGVEFGTPEYYSAGVSFDDSILSNKKDRREDRINRTNKMEELRVKNEQAVAQAKAKEEEQARQKAQAKAKEEQQAKQQKQKEKTYSNVTVDNKGSKGYTGQGSQSRAGNRTNPYNNTKGSGNKPRTTGGNNPRKNYLGNKRVTGGR